jgi:hypothetical protein
MPLPLGLALALTAPAVLAQPHEYTRGDYTLRSSVVASTAVSEVTAREHGIVPAANRAILNVTLQRASPKAWNPVPAEVTVHLRDTRGVARRLQVREVRAGGGVSYLSDFEYAPAEVLEFEIIATPVDGGRPLELRFRDRLFATAPSS